MVCWYRGERLLFLSAALADKHKVYEYERERWTYPISMSDMERQARHGL